MTFDPGDPKTWPAVLTLEEVAAIYRRSAEAIRHSLKPGRGRVQFSPRPFRRSPSIWRKADLMRDLRGKELIA